MSLDIYLTVTQPVEVFEGNITHNLGKMAGKVVTPHGTLYMLLWRPEEIGITHAAQLIEPLQACVDYMVTHRVELEVNYSPPVGGGDYKQLITETRKYLAACVAHPGAKVSVTR